VKILEAGKKARRMFNFIHKGHNTADEMEDNLSSVALDFNVVRIWQKYIDSICLHGMKALIIDRSPIANSLGFTNGDLDIITEEQNFEPWLLTQVRYAYKAVFREQWNAQINTWDPLSRVAVISEIGDTDFADDWPFDGNPLTKWAYTLGNNAYIHGGVKRGKTNFALRLAEYFMAEDWVVVSNIPLSEKVPNYHYTPTLSELLREICQARLAGKHVLILLDEGAIFWIKMDTILSQNKAMHKIVLTLGKLTSTLIYVGHRQKDIPSIVVWTAVASFEKISHKTVFADIDEGIRIRSKTFTSVPATKLQYNPSKVQNFEMDLEIDGLFKHMSQIAEEDNQWEKMLEYLADHEGELKNKSEGKKKKEAAQLLKQLNPDLTERDIAGLVHVSQPSAHNYISERKSNQDR